MHIKVKIITDWSIQSSESSSNKLFFENTPCTTCHTIHLVFAILSNRVWMNTIYHIEVSTHVFSFVFLQSLSVKVYFLFSRPGNRQLINSWLYLSCLFLNYVFVHLFISYLNAMVCSTLSESVTFLLQFLLYTVQIASDPPASFYSILIVIFGW